MNRNEAENTAKDMSICCNDPVYVMANEHGTNWLPAQLGETRDRLVHDGFEMYAVVTPGIRELVMNPAKGGRFAKLLQIALNRHMNGDWGDICEEDCAVNDEEPEYALGVYDIDGTTVWIKNDDGIRTILLPEEY